MKITTSFARQAGALGVADALIRRHRQATAATFPPPVEPDDEQRQLAEVRRVMMGPRLAADWGWRA